MFNQRQNEILTIIENKGDVSLQDLSLRFPDISVMTLRRDLITLETSGHVVRTRGGAVGIKMLGTISGEEDAYSSRARENMAGKKIIADKALRFIQKGSSMYLDAGSTIMCLATNIPDENYSIVTNGVNIAQKLVQNSKISVVLPGGTVNSHTLSVSGPNSLSFLDNVNLELAFMSASAFSLNSGFTVSNIYECELKKKVIKRAKKVIMLMDSSKIDKQLLFTVTGLEDIDVFICDTSLPDYIKEAAQALNIEIL